MATGTKYKVNWNLDFGKKQYREGNEIRESDIPANQVDVLLKCGVISPIGVADQVEVDETRKDDPTGDVLEPEHLATLTKGMLAEYAKEQYAADLDPATLTKDALLAAIAELAAKAAETK